MLNLGGIFNWQSDWSLSVRLICDYFFEGGMHFIAATPGAENPSYATAV